MRGEGQVLAFECGMCDLVSSPESWVLVSFSAPPLECPAFAYLTHVVGGSGGWCRVGEGSALQAVVCF